MLKLNHLQIQEMAKELAKTIDMTILHEEDHLRIFPVPRGGIPVAYLIKGLINNSVVVDDPSLAHIIVDDLIDSGATRDRYTKQYGKPFYALIDKNTGDSLSEWIEFVWEIGDQDTPVIDNLIRVEQFIEGIDDPEECQPLLNKMMDIINRFDQI